MDDDHGLEIDILEFEMSLSLDDFVNWLYAIEKAFESKGYFDEKVILKFKDYTLFW